MSQKRSLLSALNLVEPSTVAMSKSFQIWIGATLNVLLELKWIVPSVFVLRFSVFQKLQSYFCIKLFFQHDFHKKGLSEKQCQRPLTWQPIFAFGFL